MTARSIRRATERKAHKEEQRKARFAASQQVVAPANLLIQPTKVPGKSGPNTPEGKAISSLNAVKTALTGRTVLLPSDDAALYLQHVQEFAQQFQPVGHLESALVQSLADTAWRLLRIPALEMALYASGHEQFADQFADRDPALRNSLIQMQTFLHYEKQFRNLHLQEGRLRRNREKDTAELRRLQQERSQKQELPVEAPVTLPSNEEEFEFSLEDIDAQLNAIHDDIAARQAAYDERQSASNAAIAA